MGASTIFYIAIGICVILICRTHASQAIKNKLRSEADVPTFTEDSYSKDLPCAYQGSIIFHGDTLIVDEHRNCTCDNSTVRCFDDRPAHRAWVILDDACDYRSYIIPLGDTLIVDECTDCTCVKAGINSTILCNIKRCKPTLCDYGNEQIQVEGECCPVCPNDAPTFDDLSCSYLGNITLHGDTLDECTSCTCDNSTGMCNIKTCQPTLEICDNGKEPVMVEGECCAVCLNESLSCSYRDSILSHGETLKFDDCTMCTCNYGTIKCDIQSCPPTSCDEPVDIEGECCDVCPYDVPVYDVEFLSYGDKHDRRIIREDAVNKLDGVHLQISVNDNGQSVRGSGLWKVGMWASKHADGYGKKVGFEEQVLTEEQASRNIQKPYSFPDFKFVIPDVKFSLNASGTSCTEMDYLCVSFNKGDVPETPCAPEIVPFNVYGVESRNDSSPNPANLMRCVSFGRYCKNKHGKRRKHKRNRLYKHQIAQ